jgi:hypothetical protein
MSFILTVYTSDRIIMAAGMNSTPRLTLLGDDGKTESHQSIAEHQQEMVSLVFGRIGISTCGMCEVNGIPISVHIENLFDERRHGEGMQVEDVCRTLYEYFQDLDPHTDVAFYVAGYEQNHQSARAIWFADVRRGILHQLSTQQVEGIAWYSTIDGLCSSVPDLEELDDIVVITPDKSSKLR